MDKFNLIKKALNVEPTEKVPYAIWKHFPEFDKNPEGLLKAHIDFRIRNPQIVPNGVIHRHVLQLALPAN